jgi:hypothetical protein
MTRTCAGDQYWGAVAGDQGWSVGTWVALGVAAVLLSVAWLLAVTWTPPV